MYNRSNLLVLHALLSIWENAINVNSQSFKWLWNCYSQTWDNPYFQWTQISMSYHRLWVITVWVISGLTVFSGTGRTMHVSALWWNRYRQKNARVKKGWIFSVYSQPLSIVPSSIVTSYKTWSIIPPPPSLPVWLVWQGFSSVYSHLGL